MCACFCVCLVISDKAIIPHEQTPTCNIYGGISDGYAKYSAANIVFELKFTPVTVCLCMGLTGRLF